MTNSPESPSAHAIAEQVLKVIREHTAAQGEVVELLQDVETQIIRAKSFPMGGSQHMCLETALVKTQAAIAAMGMREQAEDASAREATDASVESVEARPSPPTFGSEISVIEEGEVIKALQARYHKMKGLGVVWGVSDAYHAVKPFLRSTKPVSVSLERCAQAIFAEDDSIYIGVAYGELSEGQKEKYRDMAKAVLDAAGVKYGD